MTGIARAMMKTPVIIVAVALTAAILLAASLVIATGTRGGDGKAAFGGLRSLPHVAIPSSPAKAVDQARARSPTPRKFDII
jgi:hypothetical protein